MPERIESLEDRTLLAADFGDAPDTSAGVGAGNYETLSANGGPSHTIDVTQTTLFLGNSVDGDNGTLQNAAANADDVDGALPDDEDGVVSPYTDLRGTLGAQPAVTMQATNTTGSAATLYGWIDYNNDGVFDNATERADVAVPDGTTDGRFTLTFPSIPDIRDAFTGETYARFRLSTDGAAANPTALASDGEVEDYAFSVTTPAGVPLAVIRHVGINGDLQSGGSSNIASSSLASIGDVDGDGIGDLAVGARGDSGGSVHVHLLNADGSVRSSTKNVVGSERGGSSVAGLGDLDGDGVPDIAVGASRDGTGEAAAGALHVMLLNADGTVKSSTKIASDRNGGPTLSRGDGFGTSVAVLGDVDGDGIVDLAVGAPTDDTFGFNAGVVYLVRLNTDGTAKSATKIAASAPTLNFHDPFYGSSVTAVGDLDQDGVTELVVGARGYNSDGAVYVLRINADGTFRSQSLLRVGTDNFGISAAALGDVDGDGVTDVAVGDRSKGVSVLFLNASGSLKSAVSIPNGLYHSIAPLGDRNGDGVIDLAMGNSRATVTGFYLAPPTDYGDAPDSYKTLLSSDGARHITSSDLYLGAGRPDSDRDGFGDRVDAAPVGDADDDDTEGGTPDDEDGVSSFDPLTADTTTFSVDVTLGNTSGTSANLVGWIDFDRSGTFDPDEAASATVANNATTATLTWTNIGGSGPNIRGGDSYARFRLTTDSISANDPGGAASDGEVEDYALTITSRVPVVESGGSTDVTEGGASDTYQLQLADTPAGAVEITVTADAQTEVSLDGTNFASSQILTRTSTDPLTITVRAVDDFDNSEDSHTSTITHTITATADPAGFPLSTRINPVVAQVTDNFRPRVRVTETGGSTTTGEDGTTDTYEIQLVTTPAGAVEITVTADAQSEVSLDGSNFATSQVFTRTSTTPQTITVRTPDDLTDEGGHTATITHAITASADSADYSTSTPIESVIASVLDNDRPMFVGVDFNRSAHPQVGWTGVYTENTTTSNLINVSGDVTGIDLTTGGFDGFWFSTPNVATLPVHSQYLAGLDEYIFDNTDGSATITWSDLSAFTAYQVYVFGLQQVPNTNNVTITGSGPPVSFTQSFGANQLFVNDQVGSNTRTLESYAKTVTPTSAGVITIDITEGATPNLVIGAVAIGAPAQTRTEVSVAGGNLMIDDVDGDQADNLAVSVIGDDVRVTSQHLAIVAGAGATQVDNRTIDIPLSSISNIVVNTRGGADRIRFDSTFDIGTSRAVISSGGDGADTVTWESTASLASLDVSAETINLASGPVNTAGPPTFTGNVVLGDNTTFAFDIGGTTAGQGAGLHDQLVATGSVSFGSNVTLSTSAIDNGSGSSFVPGEGDAFTIIRRSGGTGTFAGLADGAAISNFLGSGLSAVVSYAGGDGDDVAITVVASTDFGDAPDSYRTLDATGGPKHTISSDLYLGSVAPDVEADGFGNGVDNAPVGDAADDDGLATDDEDSIAAFPPLLTTTVQYTVTVGVTNTSGASANLVGWIDFDGNGQFDADEAATAAVAHSDTSAILTWNDLGSSGPDVVFGGTYARFRLTSDAITAADPGGAASDGEVEDYAVSVARAVSVTQSGGSTIISEDGVTDTYEIQLGATPAGPVEITVTADSQSEISLDGSTFSTSQVFSRSTVAPQTIAVRAIDDFDNAEGNHTSTISHAITTTGDSTNFPTSASINSVVAGITDNVRLRVPITESGGSTNISEDGVTDTYDIALATVPAGPVEITVTADAESEVSLDGISFASAQTFTRTTTAPQTITVRAVDDLAEEGSHTSTITHAITTTADSANYPTSVSIASVVADVAENDASLLVGVDFDGNGGNSPTGWTRISHSQTTQLNLIDETGTTTEIDLAVSGFNGFFTSTINASSLPAYSQSLAGLDNYLFDNSDGAGTFTWSDLSPSTKYQVYVFGLQQVDNSQRVTITGAGAPDTFTQNYLAEQLFVNDAAGLTARSLQSYAKTTTSTAGGEITIALDMADRFLAVGGVAIGRSGPAPTSVSVVAGNLVIDDADGIRDDDLTLSINGGNVRVSSDYHAILAGSGATQVDDHTIDVPLSSVADVVVNTRDGVDRIRFDSTFDIGTSRGVTVDGGTDADTIIWESVATLASLDVTAETITLAAGNVNTTGARTFTGDVNLNDDTAFAFNIGGTTAGQGAGLHEQLVASGSVTIGSNVTLTTSAIDDGGGSSFVPAGGDTFTIIRRDGGTGTFAGLAEGARIANFLGSGLAASISYTGGDGDDVVLTVLANTAPTIAVGDLSYTEGENSGDPVVIDSMSAAGDVEDNWGGGSLTVQISANANVADEISIGDVGSITVNTSIGQISAGGTHFATATVATATVTHNATLTITFNANATDARVQDLLRAVRYRNTSNTPGASARTVTFTLADDVVGSVETSTITVTSVADDPVVTSPAAATTVNADNVSIDGTAEANALVQVYSDANNNGMIDGTDAVVASQQLSGGATAFSISTPLTPDAANNFLVTATDASTDESDPVDVPTITEDSTGPTPVITATQSSPTADDPINVTIDFGEVVTGFALGDVTVGNGTAGNLNTADNRTFTVDVSPTADGVVTIDVAAGVAQEALGNDNQAAAQFSITSDRTAPVVTVDPTTTTDTTPALTGTVGGPGATVNVTVDGTTHMAVNNGDGTWTLADNTVAALTAGVHNVVVTATDVAGNVGSDSTANELSIAVFAFDFGAAGSPVEAGFTQVLTSTVIPASPSAGDFGWTSSTGLSDRDRTNVTSDRDRDYHKSGGSKTFQAVLPNGEYNVTFTIGSGADPRNNVGVLIEGTQVATVNTTPGQFATQTHLVMISDGLLDLELQKQGSTAVGLNALTILPATNEPRLDAVDASGFHRLGDPATAIDPALTLTDPDDASLTGAEVRVISGFVPGEDVLGFTDQNGITGSFNAGTGVLTLTGTTSVADYQTALRSVTFDSTGTTSGSRGIQFAASDGTTGTGYDTRSLTVIPSGGASLDFDFNDTGSPTEPGFIPITVSSLFVGGPGFGWLNDAVTNGLAARDRGAPNDLNRDYHKIGSGTMTFAVNLPNSVYDVTITIGSNVDPRNSVGVFLENTQVDTFSTTSSQFSTMTHRVTVSDGRLEVKLQRQGSTGVGINALRVAEVTGAPSVSLANGAAVFVSGGGAIPVDGSLTVADIDSPNLTGATVSIIGGLNAAADSLSFTDQLGITGSYVGSTGILTLTGTATVADYQTALRSVQFNSTDNTGIRTVQVDVNDGSETGSDTRDIIVSAPFSGSVSYDFGTQTSDVEAGFIGVDETSAFNVALGYGWLSTTGLSSRNRNAPIPLDQRRDYVRIGSGSMTFAVNLPNGDYDVQLTVGSSENLRHNVGVIMEGTQVDTISTAVNQFATPTHRVTVSDNRLEVELARQGASAASINALVITKVV